MINCFYIALTNQLLKLLSLDMYLHVFNKAPYICVISHFQVFLGYVPSQVQRSQRTFCDLDLLALLYIQCQ
jgi:hypothetical protein